MVQESPSKEEQLFQFLVSTFRTSAWIALGKMKNPVTDSTEVNIDQASYYIDLLDMLQTKARGNMSEYEEQMLINAVSELRMDFIKKKNICIIEMQVINKILMQSTYQLELFLLL